MKYIIKSPDGFAIDRDTIYTSKKQARRTFLNWLQRFETQGYYSSPKWGRIPIEDVESYCELVTL